MHFNFLHFWYIKFQKFSSEIIYIDILWKNVDILSFPHYIVFPIKFLSKDAVDRKCSCRKNFLIFQIFSEILFKHAIKKDTK